MCDFMDYIGSIIFWIFQVFIHNTQVYAAHNNFKTSWTQADADAMPKCNSTGVAQAEADFSNCVDGTVVTNYGTPYDFESIMHYGLKR